MQPLSSASSTVFARARWSAGLSVMFAFVAMLLYPGGTTLDHSALRYSISQNFLSDLGMTVAYDGQSNRLGAACFVASLAILVVGLGGSVIGLVRIYSRSAASRSFARVAGVVGLLVCAAFTGVALTPENRAMALHIEFTHLAFRIFPAGTVLLALASRADASFPRRMTIAWAILSVALIIYVGLLEWGPRLATLRGLEISVISQKTITAIAISILLYQSYLADRLAKETSPT